MIKKNDAKASIYLDKRYTKIDGSSPVKIRISFRRQSKYYPTGIHLTKEKFEQQSGCDLLRSQKIIGTKEYNELRKIKDQLESLLLAANIKIDNLYQFSFEGFESEYVIKYIGNDDVFERYEFKIEELIQDDQIGTSITYKNSLACLKKFTNSDKLPLSNVTVKF
jgi:hypothetical protein